MPGRPKSAYSLRVAPQAMAADASEVVARLQEAVQAGYGRVPVFCFVAKAASLYPDGSHGLPSGKPQAMA